MEFAKVSRRTVLKAGLFGGASLFLGACQPTTGAPAPAPGPAQPTGPAKLVFSSGPTGGSWIPLAGAVSELVKQKSPEIEITVEPGATYINIEKLAAGKADLGWANLDGFYDALEGRPPMRSKITNVYYMVYMYPNVFQVAVPEDSGVRSFRDLKGRSVALPPQGNSSLIAWEAALKAHGMTIQDFGTVSYGSIADHVELIKNRQADAMGWFTTVPASFMLDLGTSRKMRILSFDDEALKKIEEINKGYRKHIIPAGTYREQGHPEQAVTFQTPTIMIVRAELPEDLVYRITKIVVENKDELARAVPAIKNTQKAEMGQDLGVPYHPGALKYYKEAGIVK